ncbi:MAG: hypothetical protein ACHQ0J_08175 [Candidatus Dormibacterales bacterium]
MQDVTARPPSRAGDVRASWLLWVLVACAFAVLAGVLVLTNYEYFYYDEWDFVVGDRSWSLSVFLMPHNEHWSTLPILIWKLLFVVVGLRSHVPYEAALLVAHVASVLILFMLIRRRSGDLPAFAAALTLLVLGGGGKNIVWAFQLGFVGSVAFGLLSLLLLEGDPPFPRRVFPAAAALLASLMCSGVGLAFVVAAGVALLFDPRRRRFLPAVFVPIALFGVWFLVYGAQFPGSPGTCPACPPSGFQADVHRPSLGLSYFETMARFIGLGLATSAGAIFASPAAGVGILPILAIFVGWYWYRQRRVQSWQLGLIAGAIAWFTLVGLGRAWLGIQAATDTHYVYVGAVFLLPLIADAARKLPWAKWWRPVFAVAFAIGIFANAVQLRDLAIVQTNMMRTQRVELQTVAAFRGAPDMNMGVVLDQESMPQLHAGPYLSASAELGYPFAAPTIDTLRHLPPAVVDQEMVKLFGGKLAVSADPARSTQGLLCQTVDSTAGSTIDVQVTGGRSVMFQSTKSGEAYLYLGFLGVPASKLLQHVALSPSSPEWVYVPNTGQSTPWRLRIQTTPVGAVVVCGASSFSTDHYGYTPYRIAADRGSFYAPWSAVPDPSASHGRAVRLPSGTHVDSYTVDAFENWVVPNPGLYDVWFRVRVANPAYTTPELQLGLWDGTAQLWAISEMVAPSQVGARYSWVKVGAGIMPKPDHAVQFLAVFAAGQGTATLSTDWYFDEAVLVPIGSPPPAP